jgi:carboxylate-amine ligase
VTPYDPHAARAVFESSTDFTVGLEEEFGLLDPDTLSLCNVFEEVRAEADNDELLAGSVAGELIASEVEIRSGKGEDFHDALERQHERRRRLFALADSRGIALGATGTHPWSPWQEQRIIDTPHYRLVEEKLKYVAWRNNTFSNHVHVGIRDADRAVAVCDALRPVLPVLLAASANSPYVEGVLSGLHSSRTWTFFFAPARSTSTPRSGGACVPTSRTGRWRSASWTPSPAPASPRPCWPWRRPARRRRPSITMPGGGRRLRPTG